MLGLLLTLSAQGQSQVYYCAGGLDSERRLYVTELFKADHSDAAAIGVAFREFVEAHYGYTIPFPLRNPCKAFPLPEQASQAKQQEIDDSRDQDPKVIETGWTYEPRSPVR